MAFCKVFSGSVIGLDPYTIEVEVNIDYQGFPAFSIVGLAAKEIDEAKERVRSAIKNAGFNFPPRKITVNLAPADVPKRGSLLDVPIALGILKASGQIKGEVEKFIFLGELSLNGNINSVEGLFPLAFLAKKLKKGLVIPSENLLELTIVKKLDIYPIETLNKVVELINDKPKNYPIVFRKSMIKPQTNGINADHIDFADIKGQYTAKRVLEIAAAGGHNVFLTGPPGTGKTILATALKGIMLPLSENEALETTKIYSIAGLIDKDKPFVVDTPFRAPHHSVTKAGLLGGGNPITPGEISLAHNGILFLDEFSEFPRAILESLRQPMENRNILISRAGRNITFPADFMLIAASNPCPCGNLGNPNKQCVCFEQSIKKYRDKLSGPIADRIDMNVFCTAVKQEELTQNSQQNESSQEIKARVFKAKQIQNLRYAKTHISKNADLQESDVKKWCRLNPETEAFLKNAYSEMRLSARAYSRILKVGRTIADLQNEEEITTAHLSEALQYKNGA